MIKKIMSFALISSFFGLMLFGQRAFDPKRDGWYFENWGEKDPFCLDSCDFSWELFRRTYLGVSPSDARDPFDAAFYEVFKNCAQDGNCGGMSVLALALFKYGGYFGFCSPANFYTGIEGPDNPDLHRAINIIHARQFSYSGITRFLDAVDRGTLENPNAAFSNVEAELGKGDYPVLWISQDPWGEGAHTVIPYKTEKTTAKKYIYIWDSNHPYDDNVSRYEDNIGNKLEITTATGEWSYTSGSNHYGRGGWCLCVPMSDILRKSRHPFAMDVFNEALRTLLVGGPGAAVNQITDSEGRHYFKTEKDVQAKWSDVEKDPKKRIPGLARWPWLGQVKAPAKVQAKALAQRVPPRPEIYFMRIIPGRKADLTISLTGNQYKALFYESGNLIEIVGEGATKAKDIIRFSGIGTLDQMIEIKTSAIKRNVAVRQLRSNFSRRNFREIEVKNLALDALSPANISTLGDLEGLEVAVADKAVSFDLEMKQGQAGQLTSRKISGLQTIPGKKLRLLPKNWRKLETSEIEKKEFLRESIR